MGTVSQSDGHQTDGLAQDCSNLSALKSCTDLSKSISLSPKHHTKRIPDHILLGDQHQISYQN